MDVAAMLELRVCGPTTFEGLSADYPWGRLYGGQLVSQALRAAAATVPEGHRPHSLQAYFLRLGENGAPVRYVVDLVRDGRSFSTRAVHADQGRGELLTLMASFQAREEGFSVQTEVAPAVPTPEECVHRPWSPHFERRVPKVDAHDGRATAWMRLHHALPAGDPVSDACALTFLSDDMAADAIGSVLADYVPRDAHPHPPGTHRPAMSASLAHSMWFHLEGGTDDWLLQDLRCHALLGSRGLAVGHIFDRGGRHLASLAQEFLLRRRRTT